MQRTQVKNSFIALLVILVLVQGAFLLRRGKVPHEAESKEEKTETAVKEGGEHDAITLRAEAQKNAGLQLEEAKQESVQNVIQVTGTVQQNEARIAHIRLLSRGRIEKVNVRVGDRVQAGEPLLLYDNIELAELVTQYIKANDALKKDITQADVLKRAYDRAKNLTELGALAGAEEERRKAEYENALTALNSDRADVARTKQQLARFGVLTDEDARSSRSVLKAPFSGIVTEVKATEGELKNADEEVFTVSDLSSVWVLGDVYQRDLASIRAGLTVRVTVEAFSDRTFRGRVTYVSDILDPKTRTAKVRCEVENPRGELKIGMFANVLLPQSSSREGVTVPEDAVQVIKGKSVVFVREGEERFEAREVELGSHSKGSVEVKKGVEAGERVVVRGSFALKSQLLKGEIGGEEKE